MKRRSHLVHGWLSEAFADEPVYSEALHAPEDVLYSGSEDETYNSPTERRERYEDKGQRFLQGKPLLLLSASLRGPFTKESGWTNPWRSNTSRKRRVESEAAQATPGRAEEESIVIAATPTILESAVRRAQEKSHVQEEASPKPNTPATPHPYLDDEILYEIKTWQDTIANESQLEDPFDENTNEPSSPATLRSLEVEITPRTHGSRSFIVSSSVVAEEVVDEDSVEDNHEDIVEQNKEVNVQYSEEEEAGFINVDDEDDSSLTDLDEEQIEEQNEEQEAEEDEEGEDEDDANGEDLEDKDQEQGNVNQQIPESLPVQPPSDYDSPTKRPVTSQPLPQPHGKLDIRPREDLGFLPVDTIDLSPAAVKIYEESLRGSTCYSPSWRAQERRVPGLVGATLPGDHAAQSPSNRSGRSLHASTSDSTSHYQRRPNQNGSVTLEYQIIEPQRMLVDNLPSEPDETKDSPNQPSDVPSHHQQIIQAQPESPQHTISTADRPQSHPVVTDTVPETIEGEQKSYTTDPTSPSSSEISSRPTSFEEEEEEPVEEPSENVRKLLWPKPQRQASTQESTLDMALGIPSATASFAQAGPRHSQNGSVPEPLEHHGEETPEYLTINQQPENDRELAKAEQSVLNSQSPSHLLQSQPQSGPEATVSEESIYDDTINQVRLEWPTEASSLPRQSQVQTQNSLPVASIEEPSIIEHDIPAQHITPEQAKRSVNVMDLAHITNPTSRNATPLRPSPGLQKPFTKPLKIPVLVQPRSSVTPEAPVNPGPDRTQLSVIASQALAQAVQPVIQQSPWAKGDSQITALAAPEPEPRFFNPVSSPLSSPASSSCFVDMENSALPVLSYPPVPGNNAQPEEDTAVPPAQAQTPQLHPPHPPSTPETKRSSLPTPEFTMSIKSFKHFMTPSPKRPAKRPRLSLGDGRLPDTQALEEAVVTNPWDSSRLDGGTIPETAMTTAPSRKNKRVSWAPLPGEVDYVDPDISGDMDVDVDMEDPVQLSSVNRMKNHGPRRSILATSASISNYRGIPRRAASPPPSISMPSVDSLPKESQKFGKHFAAVSGRRRLAPKPPTAIPVVSWSNGNRNGESPMLRDVSGNARSTGTSRLAKRLLPTESQQTCGSPAVDGMANAFVQADRQVENLNLNHRQQVAQANTLITGKGIWQDPTELADPVSHHQKDQRTGVDDGFRLPNLPGFDSQPQFEETDEVTEVMDNLDDFIDSWDIDEELAEARGERRKTKVQPSKLGQGLSTGLDNGLSTGQNLWDSPSSRPQSTLKRKRTGDDEEAEHGVVESQERRRSGGGGGGGIYDPGVWDRIV